jgi:hypothetical protein
LYSGKAMGMQVIINVEDKNSPLIKYSSSYFSNDSTVTINLQHWAMAELNTPQFPEWFYYKKMAEILKIGFGNKIYFNLYNTPHKDSLNKILNK